MKIKIAALIFIGSMMLMRADQLVESVQQALKDQGFYYGEISSEMNATLTAAIRRYQIRNGLQVTGELNDETLRSLRNNPSKPSPAPAITPAPTTPPDPYDLRNDSARDSDEVTPAPTRPFTNVPPQDRQLYPQNPNVVPTAPGSLF